jgi:hypothetical protein
MGLRIRSQPFGALQAESCHIVGDSNDVFWSGAVVKRSVSNFGNFAMIMCDFLKV